MNSTQQPDALVSRPPGPASHRWYERLMPTLTTLGVLALLWGIYFIWSDITLVSGLGRASYPAAMCYLSLATMVGLWHIVKIRRDQPDFSEAAIVIGASLTVMAALELALAFSVSLSSYFGLGVLAITLPFVLLTRASVLPWFWQIGFVLTIGFHLLKTTELNFSEATYLTFAGLVGLQLAVSGWSLSASWRQCLTRGVKLFYFGLIAFGFEILLLGRFKSSRNQWGTGLDELPTLLWESIIFVGLVLSPILIGALVGYLVAKKAGGYSAGYSAGHSAGHPTGHNLQRSRQQTLITRQPTQPHSRRRGSHIFLSLPELPYSRWAIFRLMALFIVQLLLVTGRPPIEAIIPLGITYDEELITCLAMVLILGQLLGIGIIAAEQAITWMTRTAIAGIVYVLIRLAIGTFYVNFDAGFSLLFAGGLLLGLVGILRLLTILQKNWSARSSENQKSGPSKDSTHIRPTSVFVTVENSQTKSTPFVTDTNFWPVVPALSLVTLTLFGLTLYLSAPTIELPLTLQQSSKWQKPLVETVDQRVFIDYRMALLDQQPQDQQPPGGQTSALPGEGVNVNTEELVICAARNIPVQARRLCFPSRPHQPNPTEPNDVGFNNESPCEVSLRGVCRYGKFYSGLEDSVRSLKVDKEVTEALGGGQGSVVIALPTWGKAMVKTIKLGGQVVMHSPIGALMQ